MSIIHERTLPEFSEVTTQKGDAVNEGGREELLPEMGLGVDWRAPSLLLLWSVPMPRQPHCWSVLD